MNVADCPGKAEKRRYANLMLRVADHPDAHLRRDAFLALVKWIDGSEEEIAHASIDAISDLEDTVVWRGALSALIAAIRSGKSGERLDELVRSLRTAEVQLMHNADKDHGDLPARRRLVEICNSLQDLGEDDRTRLRGIIQGVAIEVEKDDTLWEAAARLRLAVIDWDEASSVTSTLADLAASAYRVPWRIHQLTRAVDSALQRDDSRWQPEDAESWLRKLDALEKGNASATLCHVKLIIVTSAARRIGWASPSWWVEELRILRDHPDLGVRTAALNIVVRAK